MNFPRRRRDWQQDGRLVVLVAGLALGFPALAQFERSPVSEAPVAASSSTRDSEVPQVPGINGLLRGVNAGLTMSGLHDSETGWATIAQPAIGYSFNDIFSADMTIPIYMYRLAESRDANPRADARLVVRRAELGDLVLALHGQFLPRGFEYQVTASATAPTGDERYGLTSGRPTFDLSNRFEHAFRATTPAVEIGVGDSTTLVNQLVTRNFTSLGPLAHFQAGFAFPLRLGASFETNAYEQLPLGDQKTYRSIAQRGNPGGPGPGITVVTGRSVSEDNGFTNSVDVPLDGHTTLSAYYNRSLRFHDDVVSFGVTYVLRGVKRSKESKDDRLLRNIQKEIEQAPPDTAEK